METHQIALMACAGVSAIAVLFLLVKAVRWTGRDARRRGFRPVWLLQLLVVLEFPWPWLVYYLVTRNLDRQRA